MHRGLFSEVSDTNPTFIEEEK